MAQWINVLENNSFINLTQLPLLCQKTGALAKVEPGLMAGRLTDKNIVKKETLNCVHIFYF